ncbi:MAG: hypothetical protein ACR2NN_25695 [Bryobacteraceae bacterium]
MPNPTYLAAMLFAATCFAQTPDAPKFYKLDFVVKEVEATKVVNARSYSTMISDKSIWPNSIRAGSKVPYNTSGTQYQYAEVGVNIDCRAAMEIGSELSLVVNAEVSSTAPESPQNTPIIRQNKWASTVLVPIRKPVIIFSSDDAITKRQMQLELTATPVK